MLPLIVTIIAYGVVAVVAIEAGVKRSALENEGCACPESNLESLTATLSNLPIFLELIGTIETLVRGFLIGFGEFVRRQLRLLC